MWRVPKPWACLKLLLSLALATIPLQSLAEESGSLAKAALQAHSRPTIGQPSSRASSHTSVTASRPSSSKYKIRVSSHSSELLSPDAVAYQAQYDYLLHCSGCHGSDGAARSMGRVPPLKDSIGRFLNLPEGRAYLVQVPGVNNSGLNDQAIARVMNWLLPHFAGATLPRDFAPYVAEEVARLRAQRPVDVPTYRKSLARDLAAIGQAVD